MSPRGIFLDEHGGGARGGASAIEGRLEKRALHGMGTRGRCKCAQREIIDNLVRVWLK